MAAAAVEQKEDGRFGAGRACLRRDDGDGQSAAEREARNLGEGDPLGGGDHRGGCERQRADQGQFHFTSSQ